MKCEKAIEMPKYQLIGSLNDISVTEAVRNTEMRRRGGSQYMEIQREAQMT